MPRARISVEESDTGVEVKKPKNTSVRKAFSLHLQLSFPDELVLRKNKQKG
jgi:hypothetical protein